MNIGVCIQARVGSTRLTAKVTEDISGKPMLARQIERLKLGNISSEIIVVTTVHERDKVVCEIAEKSGAKCFRGSEDDVLDRYIKAAEQFGLDFVVRIGGDDPLIDPECVNKLMEEIKTDPSYDFIYASHKKGWIYGTAAEVIKVAALKEMQRRTQERLYLEHIIPYFHDNPDDFKIKKFYSPKHQNRPDILLSVDYEEDMKIVKSVFGHFLAQNKSYFTQNEIIEYLDAHPDIRDLNKDKQSGFSI